MTKLFAVPYGRWTLGETQAVVYPPGWTYAHLAVSYGLFPSFKKATQAGLLHQPPFGHSSIKAQGHTIHVLRSECVERFYRRFGTYPTRKPLFFR